MEIDISAISALIEFQVENPLVVMTDVIDYDTSHFIIVLWIF